MQAISSELRDDFWAPRIEQLREVTLPALLGRLEAHGAVEAFRRLRAVDPPPRDSSWLGSFASDSDLYKWIEAAALAGRADLAAPVLRAVTSAQDADGYLHTFFGHDGRARYQDLDTSHELYCMGHFLEAAVSQLEASGSRGALDAALRVARHICESFGPGLDQRVDVHPELELALCRLAGATGERAFAERAAWMIERALSRSGLSLETVEPAGHAVRFAYFASGIAEVALATGDARFRAAALRLFRALVERHGYCTGALGGRWLGEAIGRPFELDDETSYAESCASVAMAQLAWRIWLLSGDLASLDCLETIVWNALPAAVGSDGASWCYANPLAFGGESEQNLWLLPFDYGSAMALRWFPPRRHAWLDVMCCPPNLARAFARLPSWIAELDPAVPTLRVLLPISSRIRGGGFDLELRSGWPWSGELELRVSRAPAGARILVRRPGHGFEELRPGAAEARFEWPLRAGWWAARHELSSMAGKVFLRRGPLVYALDDRELGGLDLRRVSVDVRAPVDERDPRALRARGWIAQPAPAGAIYSPLAREEPADRPAELVLRPYHAWPDGIRALRIWLRRAPAGTD